MTSAISRTRFWMASALISSLPSFNVVSRMASTLPGRCDQEDPDIPRDMTDDQRSEAPFSRIERPPEETGGSRPAGEGEGFGDEVEGGPGRGTEKPAAEPAAGPQQGSHNPAPPQQFRT